MLKLMQENQRIKEVNNNMNDVFDKHVDNVDTLF